MGEEIVDLERHLLEPAKNPPRLAPLPAGFYSREWDRIIFCIERVSTVADPVDTLLTIDRSLDDGRIVGAEVSGIGRLPENDPLRLRILQDGSVDMTELLLCTFYRQKAATSEANAERARKYFEAMRVLRGRVPLDRRELEAA